MCTIVVLYLSTKNINRSILYHHNYILTSVILPVITMYYCSVIIIIIVVLTFVKFNGTYFNIIVAEL